MSREREDDDQGRWRFQGRDDDDERRSFEEHRRGYGEDERSGRSGTMRDESRGYGGFDEGRRVHGRGAYDQDREYLSRGGRGGYGGYEGEGMRGQYGGRDTRWRDREDEDLRRGGFEGGYGAQESGERSIGFRGRMGEDYGYGGFGHMGQSDWSERGRPGEDGRYAQGRMGGYQGYDDREGRGRGQGRMTQGGYGPPQYGQGREPYGREPYGQPQYGHGREAYGQHEQYGQFQPRGQSQGQQYGQMQGQYGRQESYGGQNDMRGSTMGRGKGPKNYNRSDERIREEVCELLEDAELDASDIDVRVKNGEVTLEGTVDDRLAKRAAEDVVCRARGVKDCNNLLRMKSQSDRYGDKSQSTAQTKNGNSGPREAGRTS